MIKHYKNPRFRRKQRIRAKISGTEIRPRVSVFRSNKALYVQFIDDVKRITLIGMSDSGQVEVKNKREKALALGKKLAEVMLKKNITTVVFDRSGYAYHGRIKALAEGLREGGLKL